MENTFTEADAIHAIWHEVCLEMLEVQYIRVTNGDSERLAGMECVASRMKDRIRRYAEVAGVEL